MFSNFCFSYSYYVKIIFHATQKMLKIIKIFIKRACIYMEQGQRFIFVRHSSIINFINIIIFRGRNIFRVIINFWGCIVKLIGFNNNELISAVFCPFHCVILLSVFLQQARKFLSHDKELKWKSCYNIPCNTRVYYRFEDICNLNS